MTTFFYLFDTLTGLFFPISVVVHYRIFSFNSVIIAITSGPSGRVGRLVARPCCRP